MKSKLTWMLTPLLALIMSFSFAQEKTITGNVTDQSGLPLPGVSVVVVGTTSGTQTDFDGNYSINANVGQKLRFTYIGQKAVEKTIGSANTISFSMEEDAEALEEVVVTALGIERESRTLGYAVSTVKSEDLNEVRETNVLSALQGKASGILISNQSGNVGGSTRILIRGNSSLSGTVQPLFVVDGVPISNDNIATGSRITGGFDFGNRAQDINPDDIDTVTILKGASAAALYGSRASGGVIVITTKRGKKGNKASVSFNSNFRFDTPLILPDFQNSFASGDDGVYDFDQLPNEQATSGWGPSFSTLGGQTYRDIDGAQKSFQAVPGNLNDFYGTGAVSINSVTVSGAGDNGSDYRLSVAYSDQRGIVPNSSLNRTNIGFNAGREFSDKFISRTSFNYIRTTTGGTARVGANDPNVLTSIVNFLPRTTNFASFRPYKDSDGNQINLPGGQQNNPYWVAFENAPEVNVQRFFGNISMQYLPFEGFDIIGRAGYDTSVDKRFIKNSIGTVGRLNGNFTDDWNDTSELTLDLIATYNKDLNSNFNITTRGGMQWNARVFESLTNTGIDLTVPGLYDTGNAATNNVSKGFSERRIFGIFGDITFNYKNWLILNATGRNDFSSTLPVNNNSFFYPSVSLSWVFSDALDITNDIFSFGKIRGSWANVGGDTGAYLLDYNYNPDNAFFGQFGTGGTYPFDGQLAFDSNGFITNPNLKPSNQENYEVGLELGFFKSRLNINATYYSNLTEDDIIFVPTPQTSGFASFLTNVGGVSNKGFEVDVNALLVKTEDFSWDVVANFTKNETIVEDLSGLPGGALNLATEFNGIAVRAVEGKPFQLFGTRFARALDADGEEIEDQILVDADGIRQIGQPGELGTIQPDFTMGLSTTFRYKGFSLSTTFDWRQGGKMFSNTVGALRTSGLAVETAVDRDNLFVDPNTFVDNGDGTYSPNTTPIASTQRYWQQYASASIAEGNIFDATFIKWRELSFTYTFPTKALENTPIKALQMGIQARNLAIFNSEVPHIDPEASIGGAGSQLDGIERGSVPSPRSIGMNLTLNF
ncbi:SusC/RagA family TonB-linked outer membrane protein [Cellulophaga tyrosinoxydans]|uniref:TonB-linked outer membrane protein, SusC/RagA family n=1 Tax=Cellulophaga tyrosinoxydans TaxID=504486 RepID=A0A1W1ZEL2_9FLAO|nr:SusC/RagA family TonB-linked outer membrane protein [Cellulophaga tyrosinoxydans]SMC46900.1 TonB-linked outer membrane protein, SusC/RagA family [Cellulophaga tyrosinoxydans]